MKIRKAQKADISTIVDFQVRMAKETEDLELNPKVTTKGVEYIFDNPEHGFYLLSEEREEITGSLMILYEWSDWRNNKVIWIHSVYIKPEWRKKGIFGKMYAFIKELVASDEMYGGIRLYVDKRNNNAQKVYEHIGMSKEHYVLYEWMQS